MMRNWEIWNTKNIQNSNNHRMLQQLAFHAQKIIPATSVRDLNPLLCVDNAHAFVLPFEMAAIEPGDGEIPSRKLAWKPSGFLSHIKRRTINDRFPISLWEIWFWALFKPWCTNPGFNWTFSAMCLQCFSL